MFKLFKNKKGQSLMEFTLILCICAMAAGAINSTKASVEDLMVELGTNIANHGTLHEDEDGNIYDILTGTFFIAGCAEESFTSLSDEQAEKYLAKYLFPEKIISKHGELIAIKYELFGGY